MYRIRPTFRQFAQMARKGNLIPVYDEILADQDTPVSAYLKLREPGHGFLLESVEGGEKWARYSFLGSGAKTIFRSKGRHVEILDQGKGPLRRETDNPFGDFRALMKRYRPVVSAEMPRFHGGAVGYIGYDAVRFFERLPAYAKDSLGAWDIYLVIFARLVIFDNVSHKIRIVSSTYLPDYATLREAYDEACECIAGIEKKLRSPTVHSTGPPPKNLSKLRVRSEVTRQGYLRAVRQAKRYVKKGHIIQVVLSQRLWAKERLHPFVLYRSLRLINPSPYMFFLEYPEYALVGSSPEVLVRVEGSHIEVRPIAGTRPRGHTAAEDTRQEMNLRNDSKEKAEHIMLVDLGRNDIGRVAAKGSVKVDELMKVERYSHVMHLVSTVNGSLAKGKDCFDAFRACFPAGTLSGAPKIRAMEIIEELEPHRRGPYGGAVGYFSFSGNMDMAIAIRTILASPEALYFQVGAGIVADSRPEREYQECLNKARAMIKAIEMGRKGLVMEEGWERQVVYDLDDR